MLPYHKELDSTLQEIVTRWGIPGMAVGIAEGNQIIYTQTIGVQNLRTQQPVTLDSIFCVASISKCFTAAAMMRLAEQGKIDLDAPFVQYLPYFKLDDTRYHQITTRQLLCHTSGMPDLSVIEYEHLVEHPEDDEKAAERWLRKQKTRKLIANPGERFFYSNIGYNILGGMITYITGKPFETYMREEILLPSGMPDSTFLLADVPTERLAVPHLRTPEMNVNPIYPYHRADAPGSFLHSTVMDMCHWGMTSLNKGIFDRQRILSSASYDVMWSPATSRGAKIPGFYENMGLGWNLGHHKGVKAISHGGMGFGWTDFFFLFPEKNRCAIILCNEESYARSRTIQAVADAMLDTPPQAGTVSWMIPVSRALIEGDIQSAYNCYKKIKDQAEKYDFDENALLNLSYQLTSVNKFDLAIEVLELNIHVFPESVESYCELARIYLQIGEKVNLETCLTRALSIEPENIELQALRKQIK